MKVKRKIASGQSFIEAIAGILVIVPIALLLLDVAALVLCNQANDKLAKSAARAAAGVPAIASPDQRARNVVSQYRTSGNPLVESVRLAWLDYNNGEVTLNSPPPNAGTPGAGKVLVVVEMKIKVPVPFPYFSEGNFVAQAVEPIVALPPQ
jgi:hypothetical protein